MIHRSLEDPGVVLPTVLHREGDAGGFESVEDMGPPLTYGLGNDRHGHPGVPDEIGRHRADPLCGSADDDSIGIELFGHAQELAGGVALSHDDAARRKPEALVGAGDTVPKLSLALLPPLGDGLGCCGEPVCVDNGGSNPDPMRRVPSRRARPTA